MRRLTCAFAEEVGEAEVETHESDHIDVWALGKNERKNAKTPEIVANGNEVRSFQIREGAGSFHAQVVDVVILGALSVLLPRTDVHRPGAHIYSSRNGSRRRGDGRAGGAGTGLLVGDASGLPDALRFGGVGSAMGCAARRVNALGGGPISLLTVQGSS